MAKKQVQQIEIDVLTKGLENTRKSFEDMANNTGNLGKEASSIINYVDRIFKIINKYGESIPVAEVKQMQVLFEKIADSSSKISQMDKFDLVDGATLKKIEKTKDSIAELNTQIEELKKQKDSLKRNKPEVKQKIKELTGQKTATNSEGKAVNLSPIKDKWKNKKDLRNLTTSADPKEVAAAEAALVQLEKAEKKNETVVEALKDQIKSLNIELDSLTKSVEVLEPQMRDLTDTEKNAAESAEIFGEAQSRSLGDATIASQQAGKTTVEFTTKLKEQNTGIGLAVKSLFSFATAWGLMSKLTREAITTVTEMDESLTGMAMVTGKTKEEVNALIPQIQQLAQDTSTAMTEVAGLITEYTKQGRNLQESFTLAEETAKAAKISGISAAEAIDYMTSAINGFNLAATDATHVSDIFANVAAISATDFEDLAVGLSKVSAQANLAGMSIEYTTALLAKGIETTQEAPESIGTALKTILARMRELSDYGSTLEDGGSVNSVESALAAAGIKLRDVNGEFRDMEDIFNELGPKWDNLNTMQQQAIAQAIAGTR